MCQHVFDNWPVWYDDNIMLGTWVGVSSSHYVQLHCPRFIKVPLVPCATHLLEIVIMGKTIQTYPMCQHAFDTWPVWSDGYYYEGDMSWHVIMKDTFVGHARWQADQIPRTLMCYLIDYWPFWFSLSAPKVLIYWVCISTCQRRQCGGQFRMKTNSSWQL